MYVIPLCVEGGGVMTLGHALFLSMADLWREFFSPLPCRLLRDASDVRCLMASPFLTLFIATQSEYLLVTYLLYWPLQLLS